MAGYQERLIAQLGEWVVLGGGLLPPWDEAVSPEPPFRAFPGYTMHLPEGVVDGRRHTRVSRALEILRSLPETIATEETDATEEIESPPEEILDERGTVVEFQILLPPNCSISPAEFEYFLHSISSTAFPVCFEIVADTDSTTLQLCCDPDDARFILQCIEAHLPKLSVVEQESFLLNRFLEEPEHAIASGMLALNEVFLLPIRGLRHHDRDPYQRIFATMAALNPGECGVIQINFKACRHDWTDSMLRLVTATDGSPTLGTDTKELVSATREKTRKPLFSVTVRLAAIAASEERAAVIANTIFSSFSNYTDQNGFCIAENHASDADDRKVDVVLRRFRHSGILLNADELCSLVHIPGKDVHAPKLLRQIDRTAPAPESAVNRSDLILGLNQHRGSEQLVGLSTDERTKHIHVMGASGTGKSTFLLNCILQDIDEGHGCALLDPHGDLAEAVLKHLPENRIQDVVLFDPADEAFPVGFNMLSTKSEVEKNLLASDFVSIFKRLSAAWGDQMTAVLGNATLAILESPNGGTLIDLRRFLVEKGFRTQFLKTVQDPEIRYFWQYEFPLMKGNTQVSLLTRLNSFLRQKLIRNMVAQDGRKLDFADMMDSGKIFLAPLSQGLIGQENSWLLGSLLVSKFYQIALARQTQAESSRRPFWLYVDEAHNFITASIASILSGTRKYGLGLILSHQDLDQFGRQDAAILSSILTNSHTRVYFRVGDQDARKLQEGFEHFESEDLRKLKTGSAICRIGGSDRDFNLLAAPPPEEPEDASIAQRARDHSRSKYATPREEIEAGVHEQTSMGAAALEAEANARRTPRAKTAKAGSAGQPPVPPAPETKEPREPAPAATAPPATPPQHDEPPRPEASPESVENAPPAAQPAPTGIGAGEGVQSSPDDASEVEKLPGRGGLQHKLLQQQIKQHANGLGLRATIEAGLPDGAGLVDVLVEGGEHRIAFEIALLSPIEQELKNITKSLDAKCTQVVVVSDASSHLDEIREAAEQSIAPSRLSVVRFLKSEDLGHLFAEIGADLSAHQTISRGFKVTTSYVAAPESESDQRSQAIHRAVVESNKKPPNSD